MYFVKTSDDINLAVYDYNPKGKKTVLLIHGWPLSHLMYEYQLEMLISCGYRVITHGFEEALGIPTVACRRLPL